MKKRHQLRESGSATFNKRDIQRKEGKRRNFKSSHRKRGSKVEQINKFYSFNGTLSHITLINSNLYNFMEDSHKCYVEHKKPGMKEHILCLIYIK